MICEYCKKEIVDGCACIANTWFCINCSIRIVSNMSPWKDEKAWTYVPKDKFPVYEDGNVVELINKTEVKKELAQKVEKIKRIKEKVIKEKPVKQKVDISKILKNTNSIMKGMDKIIKGEIKETVKNNDKKDK